MAWLVALIKGLWSAWLGNKTSTAVSFGESEQRSQEDAKVIDLMNAQAKAAANAPTKMSELIAEQKKGEV
jgi:hypothetical protein